MARSEKVEKVAGLKERIANSQALLLADYRGLSVSDSIELRRSLRESDARFAVVKNTLMLRAAQEAGIEAMEALLEGPTAVAFVVGDPVGAAKKVVDAAKRFPALTLKGAFLEGRVLGADEARALATLESREVMLSKVAGLMMGEMSRAANLLQTLQGRFLGLLEAYKEKLPSDEPAASAVPEEAADRREGSEVPEVPEVPEVAEADTSGEEGEE